MELNEKHHAQIISAYYEELKKQGAQGLAVFIKGAQQYGEERGRRMGLRVLRDQGKLGFQEYFAYGEWESTPGYLDVAMKAGAGTVEENVVKCPWHDVFMDRGMKDCGALYCREIDRAIVRGFNPELCIVQETTMYRDGHCSFCFRDEAIDEAMFDRVENIEKQQNGRNRLPMSYHCAHIYSVYSRIISDIYGEEGRKMISRVDRGLEERLGTDFLKELGHYDGEDFTRLPRENKLGGKTDDK